MGLIPREEYIDYKKILRESYEARKAKQSGFGVTLSPESYVTKYNGPTFVMEVFRGVDNKVISLGDARRLLLYSNTKTVKLRDLRKALSDA